MEEIQQMAVVVLGCINMDVVVQVPRLPTPGETLVGNNFFTAFGGKGANQAVALSRLGIQVFMIGQVGGDDFGQALLVGLDAVGVNVDGVAVNPNSHSGVASIVVGKTGENSIACAAGANHLVGTAEVDRLAALLASHPIVMLELGIPMDTVLAAAQCASRGECQVILDPAPVPDVFPAELYPLIDIITPNEVEASQLVDFTVNDPVTAKKASQILRNRGVRNVIITLGDQGAFCATPTETFLMPAIPVQVVDTVAAGDGFNGALAAALAQGKSLREAVLWGTVAGAMTVSKNGAQPALPNLTAFQELLSTQNLQVNEWEH